MENKIALIPTLTVKWVTLSHSKYYKIPLASVMMTATDTQTGA